MFDHIHDEISVRESIYVKAIGSSRLEVVPKRDYTVYLALPTGGNIKPCAASAIHRASTRGLRVKPEWKQFGDIPHNFNMLWCEALSLRPKFTHFAMLHDDCNPMDGWLDVLLDELDRVDADIMSATLAIKDGRGLTTVGIRYPGQFGARRFTKKELWRMPETFSVADTDEPNQILAIGTACWVCRFPEAGWPDKFPGFQNEHRIFWKGGEPEPWFDSEDWVFSEWAASQGLKVYSTRKVVMGHQGAALFMNNDDAGFYETDLQRPPRPLVKAFADPQIVIETEYPIALESLDHTQPLGAKMDNSASYAFNRKLFELITAADVRLLDLGCSGGGFVRSILEDGGFAIGIEGSDFSLKRRRAEWDKIPNHLFTADLTKPLLIRNCSPKAVKFNVFCGWEMWEHIPEADIAAVIENIRAHAEPGAVFIGSISQSVEPHHCTAKPKFWWVDRFTEAGWKHMPEAEDGFGKDLVRGLGPEPENVSYSIVFEIA